VGASLGNILPLAVTVAAFPVPIIVSVLMLSSDRGRTKALVYVLGWSFGLLSVGVLTLLLAGEADASETGDPATWVNVLLFGVGLLLLAAAVKQWRGRPSADEEPPTPGWMRAIHDLSVMRAGRLGFALTALNPKNVLLTVAAAAEIADVGSPAGQQIAVLLAFVLVGSLGVLAPLVLSLALGARSEKALDELRGWMARYNTVIMAVLFLIIGAKLIGDAVSGFSS
jgi:threonine/homoserine/homoserine lactone efflux protein